LTLGFDDYAKADVDDEEIGVEDSGADDLIAIKKIPEEKFNLFSVSNS